MNIPSFDIAFNFVRRDMNMNFEEFRNICRAKSVSFSKNWLMQPDGLSFIITCATDNTVKMLCEEVAVHFQNDRDIFIRYEMIPRYSIDYLYASRYCKLLIDVDEMDLPGGNTTAKNAFEIVLCEDCKYPKFSSIKQPLLIKSISKKTLKSKYYALHCSNGFRLFSKNLFNELKNDLSNYVDTGSVAYFDCPNKILDDVIWVRPQQSIGHNYMRDIVKKCKTCERPIIIRGKIERRAFLVCYDFYDSITNDAPMVLAGNWFGHLAGAGYDSVTWDVLISGNIFHKLCDFKARNIVGETKTVITKNEYRVLVNLEDAISAIFDARGLLRGRGV